MSGYDPLREGGRYRRRDGDAFDQAAIVIDPQVESVVRTELRRRHPQERPLLYTGWLYEGSPAPYRRPAYAQGTAPAPDELVNFRDPRLDPPRPPRSLTPAARLAWTAGGLAVVSIVAGIGISAAAFGLLFLIALTTAALARAAYKSAKRGQPALGFIPLPPASDLTGYYVAYAGRIFHRRYVRPQADFDLEALDAWERAVGTVNRIYRSESVRARVVDTARVESEVPELLWKIAEGLAKVSDVRFDLKKITRGADRFHPVVEAKMRSQERDIARGTGQVNRRIDRLGTVASRLEAADAAKRDEALLKQLIEVDPKIRDLVASTDESVSEIDMAEGMKLDVDAIVEMTNQAIKDLSAHDDDDDDPGESPHLEWRRRGPGDFGSQGGG